MKNVYATKEIKKLIEDYKKQGGQVKEIDKITTICFNDNLYFIVITYNEIATYELKQECFNIKKYKSVPEKYKKHIN